MRTIRVSEDVWREIAKRGLFGETEDDVLRRVFDLPDGGEKPPSGRLGRGARRFATTRMTSRVQRGSLLVEFEGGPRHEWQLPNKSDKVGIRNVREAATAFAVEHGATDPGQTNAVKKALTDSGYHLTK